MDIYFPPFFEAPPSEQINDVEVWHAIIHLFFGWDASLSDILGCGFS